MAETLKIDAKYAIAERGMGGHTELSMLLSDCIAQSQTAQKKLYDTYAPAAYGVIRRYMYHDEFMAQEILNDSFFKILTKLDTYNYQGSFEGWIRRIVVNTVTDYLRKTIKNEYHKEIEPEDVYVNSEPVERMSHKELLVLVHSLPDAQRTVFNLYVFENYAHKEIAAVLNINENNSRWHLNDARRRLKEKIHLLNK